MFSTHTRSAKGNYLEAELMEQQLNYLIENGTKWIVEQRLHHRPTAVELSASIKAALGPFFSPETLAAVRTRKVAQIENPGFYDDLRNAGLEIPLEFSEMDGITFIDTVLLSQAHPMSQQERRAMIFHECVHTVQYQVLGVDEFVRHYIQGWAACEFNYREIPLEKGTYELQSRFETAPDTPFSVESEVARDLS